MTTEQEKELIEQAEERLVEILAEDDPGGPSDLRNRLLDELRGQGLDEQLAAIAVWGVLERHGIGFHRPRQEALEST